MLLEGKTALVTGAGRGIGRAIALAFAEEGCDVAVVARTRAEIEDTAATIRAMGRRALPIISDVANAQSVSDMARTFLAEFGKIDLLVNSAGLAVFKPLKEMPLHEWRLTLDVNLTGPFMCTQAFLPAMIARRSGRIINISSVTGLKPIMNQGAYCASKHGLNGFSKVLAMELREYGISVHWICPGGVDTQLAAGAMPNRDRSRWMQPEDIAHACLFLASLSPRATVDEIMIRRFDSVPLGG
jgi:3-oxoacyl-[acyl-carrier protein] reductase